MATGAELKQLAQSQSAPSGSDLKSMARPDMSFGDIALGTAETAGALLSSAFFEPVAGLMGTGALIEATLRGDEDALDQAASTIDRVRSMAFRPRSQAGQRVAETVAEPFQAFGEFAQRQGRAAQDATGSPAAGAAVQTSIEFAPSLLGLRGTRPGQFVQRGRDVRNVQRFARDEGISLSRRGTRQAEQIAQAGERRAGSQRGASMEQVRNALIKARNEERAFVSKLYEEARNTRAGLPIEDAVEFTGLARQSLDDFDVADMPSVRRRLQELDALNDFPSGSSVRLSAMEKWRQRINRNRPSGPDKDAERAALDILKAQYDNFIESRFNADMVKGSPEAIQKWQRARAASQRYRQLFKDDKAIRQMAQMDVTPEEMRSWIFGASAVGLKKEAARTVGRLKQILGEDSPQFTALRQDALVDIMEPLMRDTPNLNQFVKNFDRTVGRNPTGAAELFGGSMEPLRRLRQFAAANVSRGEPPGKVPLSRMGAVAMFGHGIARGALKVNLARRAFDALQQRSNKRAFLGEVLGYDPRAPLLPKTPAIIGGGIQAGQRVDENGPAQ